MEFNLRLDSLAEVIRLVFVKDLYVDNTDEQFCVNWVAPSSQDIKKDAGKTKILK